MQKTLAQWRADIAARFPSVVIEDDSTRSKRREYAMLDGKIVGEWRAPQSLANAKPDCHGDVIDHSGNP